jgi:hypothetical protein
MRFGIDPAGQPTHDTDATSSQFMGEFTGYLTPIRTRGPRSDNGNGQVILRRKTPQDVEEGWRVVNLSEAFRIFGIGLGD